MMINSWAWVCGAISVVLACAAPAGEDAAKPVLRAEAEADADDHDHDELPTHVELSTQVIADAKIIATPAQRQVVAPVLMASGHVEVDPGRAVVVPARVSGVVAQLHVREGDAVEVGTVLATIRAPNLGRLRAELAASSARLEAATAKSSRLDALAARGMAGQQELASAKADAQVLAAEARAARQHLQALGLATKGDSSVFPLRSPVRGFVVHRGVLAGQAVEPEASVVVLADLDQAWFIARIFEHMVAQVQPGAAAEVILNAHPERSLVGVVEHVSAIVDEETQTIVARIPIANRDNLLRIGLFGRARIAVGDPSQPPRPVLAVARDAVVEVAGKTAVFVRSSDHVFDLHEVVLGTVGPGVVEVLSGLHEGEWVVTQGAWSLKSILLRQTFEDDEH